MEETKHTPGPWVVRQATGTPHRYYVSGRRGDKGESVAIVEHGEVSTKVANLRLIAAAPKMLDHLEKIAKAEGRYSRDRYEHACNTIEDMQEIARAAIAKATGEEV